MKIYCKLAQQSLHLCICQREYCNLSHLLKTYLSCTSLCISLLHYISSPSILCWTLKDSQNCLPRLATLLLHPMVRLHSLHLTLSSGWFPLPWKTVFTWLPRQHTCRVFLSPHHCSLLLRLLFWFLFISPISVLGPYFLAFHTHSFHDLHPGS